MKKKYIKIVLICLLIPQISHADFKQKIRPYLNKYLGSELTIKLLGETPEKIKMPSIPKIEESAKSTKVYTKDESTDTAHLDPEKLKSDHLNFIGEVYKVTRDARPDQNTINNWMNALTQGGTREGLYRAIVLDTTYSGLENYNYPVNDKVADFAIFYLDKFLDRQSTKETLKKSNFYTLKRVVTEKSLEIIDEYILNNKEDLYKWYAVFSGELAKKYPGAWDNQMRSSSNREAHLNWSKKVPIQNIKSEIIIKIHKVFNFLNG